MAIKRKRKSPVDNTLVRRVKATGCDESFKILTERHERLFYKMCQLYVPVAESKGLNKEDLFQEKEYVIFKAVSSYKPNKKTKFSTWLGNCTKYFCLSFLNSNKRLVDMEDSDLELHLASKSKEEYCLSTNLKNDKDYVFKILKQLKDKRISKVFKLRYFDEDKKIKKATWSRIASKINTSTQTAINLHQRGVRVLHKKLKSTEYVDKI